jgi:hypothetical protein
VSALHLAIERRIAELRLIEGEPLASARAAGH